MEEDKTLEDFPIKLDVELGKKLLSLVVTSDRYTCDFEEGSPVKEWLEANNIKYQIKILEEESEIDFQFERPEDETLFTLRWANDDSLPDSV